ncbi:large ribosomal subunit protein bL12m-like [Ptychodera flava]|uniref:large ribosomal subunit protein bL12m-like n=1 Tax=Ptychodera flava TaxID=63121 RepID=UPI00396A6B83
MTSLCRCISFAVRQVRHVTRHTRHVAAIHRVHRYYNSEPLPMPAADGEAKEYSPKIKNLVDEISKLTISEITDLNDLLKTTLNIQDAPMMVAGAAPAAAAPVEAEEEVEEPKVEKTHFTVKLTQFDAASKVKLIKEVKSLTTGMNLVQAKKFVEGVPQVVKTDVSKAEAEEMKTKLESVGGTVVIE